MEFVCPLPKEFLFSRFFLSLPIGASIVALPCLNTPSNKAKYSLLTRLFLKSSANISWTLLVFATQIKPLVSFDVIEVLEDDIDNDTNIVPVKMSLDIVYEDDYLMIINKPSGLVVHPGSGNYDNTLVKYYFHIYLILSCA